MSQLASWLICIFDMSRLKKICIQFARLIQKCRHRLKPADLIQTATLTALVAPIKGIFEELVLSFLQMV